MTKAHRHLDPYSHDKRNFHGALARHSPFAGGGACVYCRLPMTTIEAASFGRLCPRCRADGWVLPEEYTR
jgi:hypothetical protein